ncbi:hypothetical protein ACLB2K_000358 [Fragaria x ananassa]
MEQDNPSVAYELRFSELLKLKLMRLVFEARGFCQMDNEDMSISLELEEPVVERGTSEVSAHKRKKTSRCWLSFKQLPVGDDQSVIKIRECLKYIKGSMATWISGHLTMQVDLWVRVVLKQKDFDATYKSGSSSSVKSELQKYIDKERFDRKKKEFDVLSWWKMEQLRYPILGQLARDVLTIPISTIASESAFSIAGRVLDQNRSSLLPETVQALLCCRDWLFGKKDQHHTDWEQLSENVLDLTLDG